MRRFRLRWWIAGWTLGLSALGGAAPVGDVLEVPLK